MSQKMRELTPASLKIFFLSLGIIYFSISQATAAEIVVNSESDPGSPGDGDCTIREALENANQDTNTASGDCVAGNGVDLVTFDFTRVSRIVLDGSSLGLGGPDRIKGDQNGDGVPDVEITAFDPSDLLSRSGVFNLNSAGGVTEISGLKISGARGSPALSLTGSTSEIRVVNCIIEDNQLDFGGDGGAAIEITGALAKIANSTITGNSVQQIGSGGAIYIGGFRGSTVSIVDSVISNNSAADAGGGIFVSMNGDVQILRSSVSNNVSGTSAGPANANASGGGLFSDRGTIEITDSIFSGNTVTSGSVESIGGALRTENTARVQIKRSLFTQNTATNASALFVSGSLSSMENSTISENTARLAFSGNTVFSNTLFTISNSTIYGNEGNGIEAASGSGSIETILQNSIVAQSTADDCVGSINSDTATIIENDPCNSSARNVDPLLDPLSSNGGFTQSHMPQPASPALNSGLSDCTTVDQRGVGREDPCDVGAVERVSLELSDGPPSFGTAWHEFTIASRGVAPTRLGPTADAEIVFAVGQDVNDGVTLPTSSNPAGEYQATVNATNGSSSTARLCGWFDFNQDSDYSNLPNTLTGPSDPDFAMRDDSGERSCVEIPPGVADQNFLVTWNVAEQDRQRSGQFNLRFRISTDSDFFNGGILDSTGGATDGEVEDYAATIGTLPVSVHHFRSFFTDQGMEIEWSTVSETHNAGFIILGYNGKSWKQLNKQLVASKAQDPVRPESYFLSVKGAESQRVRELALVALDTRGDEDVYGIFEPGKAYGRALNPAPIPWTRIAAEVERHLEVKAETATTPQLNGHFTYKRPERAQGNIAFADVEVGPPGLYQISWRDLKNAGLDLAGVATGSIAVTLKGEAISRDIVDMNLQGVGRGVDPRSSAHIVTRAPTTFGPGKSIRFWADSPSLPDALYLDEYIYRISIEPALAKNALVKGGRSKPGPSTTASRLHQDHDTAYSFASPLSDPWYAARLRADRNNLYETTFQIDHRLVAGLKGRIEVLVAGLTDFPERPDHRIQVEVNGQLLSDEVFEGRAVRQVSSEIPENLLTTGENVVRVIAPGGTDAPLDIVLLDTISLEYPQELDAHNDAIMLEGIENAGGLTVSGFSSLDTVAYARDESNLFRLSRKQFSRGSVRVPTIAFNDADYWISSQQKILRPRLITAEPSMDILEGVSADFLIISHPAFLPTPPEDQHPLDRYLAAKVDEGWTPAVFDVTDIQRQFGFGMPVPGAVTNFLREADSRFEYTHVLLIGGDSYDYKDNLGIGSISFIPTRYMPTRSVPHTPSDSMLADITGDGLSDKALGRWPVRSFGDLQAIVAKTLDWSNTGTDLSNAVWIADSQDPNQPSFSAQIERMLAPLLDAGWSESSLEEILLDDVVPPPGMSAVDAARQAYFERLEAGRSISGFVGHGAPAMWTFQGLLTPDDLDGLFNDGMPTMIGTLTCYTTYFVSPYSDSVSHRWMNGYREDASGKQIPGVPNGSVAIHGAATLSSFEENEWFAKSVLVKQLDGLTLGEAILRTRQAVTHQSDQRVNWILLGDPTLRLQ